MTFQDLKVLNCGSLKWSKVYHVYVNIDQINKQKQSNPYQQLRDMKNRFGNTDSNDMKYI